VSALLALKLAGENHNVIGIITIILLIASSRKTASWSRMWRSSRSPPNDGGRVLVYHHHNPKNQRHKQPTGLLHRPDTRLIMFGNIESGTDIKKANLREPRCQGRRRASGLY